MKPKNKSPWRQSFKADLGAEQRRAEHLKKIAAAKHYVKQSRVKHEH